MAKSATAQKSPRTVAADLITKGKIQLLQRHPFYASLVLQMKYEPCYEISTADIDGKKIRYSPDFITGLNIREVAGLLAHEVMHVAMLHHTRRGKREALRWNYACDYAINPLLLKAGLILPDGALVQPRFMNKTAEAIYELLPPPDENAAPSFGEVRDADPDPDKKKAAETMAKHQLSQAVNMARLRGYVSSDIERLVEQILQPAVNWKEILAQFLTDICTSDYNWNQPSPRFIHLRLYLPLLRSICNGKVVVVVDTSGSIPKSLLDQFAAEISSIAGIFNIPIMVIYVDAEVKTIQEFEPGEEIILKPSGGGGTDFRPAFAYMDREGIIPSATLYLTDGGCTDFPEPTDFPLLWVQFGCLTFDPPFGQTIQLTEY